MVTTESAKSIGTSPLSRQTSAMIKLRDFSRPAVRRAWIADLLGPVPEERWDAMACELFAWQFARVPAFRRLCKGHGVSPTTLRSWRDIPAMPQQLFKRAKLFAHGDEKPGAVYETSGTTTGEPGRQYLWRTDIYRAVAVAGARLAGLFQGEPDFHFIAPAPREAPRSSLSAMFGFWSQAAARDRSRFAMSGRDFVPLHRELARARRPVALCGTAFGFVHFLDALPGELPLPPGSRLLETGGFKGRAREIPKPELYTQLAKTFHVPDRVIWNEYGMSELSSQAYAHGMNGRHITPPWARVLVVDPATGREVLVGREGLVRWIDLANVDSVVALQTLDRAERTAHGFRLIGRLPRSEPRGCSLGAEDLLGTR
jgi:phenylacetate-coenzyme A ligase PaaK-like adenylate-forming protein